MILFLKKNIYTIKFIILCFTRYKLYKYNNLSFIFKIYLIKIFFSYQFIRKIFFKTKSVNYEENHLFYEKIDSILITKQLIDSGISQSLNFKSIITDEIINESIDKKNLVYNKIEFRHIHALIDFAVKKNISRLVLPVDLDKNEKIYKIITSNFFKTVVKNYLNKNEVSIN